MYVYMYYYFKPDTVSLASQPVRLIGMESGLGDYDTVCMSSVIT